MKQEEKLKLINAAVKKFEQKASNDLQALADTLVMEFKRIVEVIVFEASKPQSEENPVSTAEPIDASKIPL